jgi:hypothetical protein
MDEKMDETDALTDREVGLILTVVNLLDKYPTPSEVQRVYQQAQLQVSQFRQYPDYPLPRQR